MQVICAPLGWLMRVAYSLTGNYGLAVIVFTLMTKLVLLPVSLWVHANGIKMVRLEPAVNRLKVKYFGDPDKVAEALGTLEMKFPKAAIPGCAISYVPADQAKRLVEVTVEIDPAQFGGEDPADEFYYYVENTEE